VRTLVETKIPEKIELKLSLKNRIKNTGIEEKVLKKFNQEKHNYLQFLRYKGLNLQINLALRPSKRNKHKLEKFFIFVGGVKDINDLRGLRDELERFYYNDFKGRLHLLPPDITKYQRDSSQRGKPNDSDNDSEEEPDINDKTR
jgi:hypothetical protein